MVKTESEEESHPVILRSVVPGLPRSKKERAQLEEDLHQIGCQGFLQLPCNLQDKGMVQELMTDQSSEWERTVKAQPYEWTSELWGTVYNFSKKGEGMASRTYKFCNGNFSNPMHSKDGYAVSDCENLRYRRMLQFLVLIQNPKRPTRVTVTLDNTLLGALSRDKKVNWRIVI